MSDPGHDVHRHKPSGSVDSVVKNWKSRLYVEPLTPPIVPCSRFHRMGSKSPGKGDNTLSINKNGLQRSVSLRTKLGGRASPRPSLDRSHSNQPSLDLNHASTSAHGSPPPSSTLVQDSSPPSVHPTPDTSRSPLPKYIAPILSSEEKAALDLDLARVLSPEDLGKIDARLAYFPEGYEERMNAAPRPKARKIVSEPITAQLSRSTARRLDTEAVITLREPPRETNAATGKEPAKLVKDKKADKEKPKGFSGEAMAKKESEVKPQKVDKANAKASKDEAKAKEKGKTVSPDTKHNPPGSGLLKKKAVDPKG